MTDLKACDEAFEEWFLLNGGTAQPMYYYREALHCAWKAGQRTCAVNQSALFERAMACLRSIKEHGYPWGIDTKELEDILKEHATGGSEGV